MDVVYPELESHERVLLTDPAAYLDFVALMRNAEFIISDSGGVQEEAPALGKPVLVLRKTTERPEAVTSGVAKLIGTSEDDVFSYANELIVNPKVYQRMSKASNPFGDGTASEAIADALNQY
jgi:UDP-N-acetylglucosamine 2-epimerase (non-hydrolysing)